MGLIDKGLSVVSLRWLHSVPHPDYRPTKELKQLNIGTPMSARAIAELALAKHPDEVPGFCQNALRPDAKS
jgi:hypothetical protein